MIYWCQTLCERGAESPKWQTAFGKRYLGTLLIGQDRDSGGLLSATAVFSPLPGVIQDDSWPRPMRGVLLLNEWDDCRFVEGVEKLQTTSVVRWLRQVWRLTPLSAAEVAEAISKIEAGRPPSIDQISSGSDTGQS